METTEDVAERGRRAGLRLLMEIGDELRHWRIAAGMSRADVARETGMSPSTIGRLERGELLSANLDQVVAAFWAVGVELEMWLEPSAAPDPEPGAAAALPDSTATAEPVSPGLRLT